MIGDWWLVIGDWFLVLGSWFLVLGSWLLLTLQLMFLLFRFFKDRGRNLGHHLPRQLPFVVHVSPLERFSSGRVAKRSENDH